jgi:hypothetical protein
MARLKKIEETLRRIGNASPFFGTGMHPTADGGMTVDGQMAGSGWDGDLDAGNVGTTGWAMNATRAALPELLLRPGSIGNEALTNPVRGDSAYTAAYGFGVTTTGTTPLASQSWLTPKGFTTADILIMGRVFAINSTAGLDYLNARSRVYVPSTGAEGYGNAMPLAVSASGGSGLNQSPISIKVEGLTDGQEIRLEIQAWTSFANWAADGNNIADVAGQIIWTR